MSGRPRALVIGGSVGGLFAAHLLRSIGWDVAVFERSGDDLARRGAGIGAGEALFAVMRRIGVSFDASDGIALKSRLWLEPSGNIAAELPFSSGHVATAWARLYQTLKGALPGECCCFNRTLVRIEQRSDGVTAIFADGSSAAGSLLIAADGMYSTVRQQLLPKVVPRYAGYVCWRGVVEEADTPSSVRSHLFERQTFCFPAGELFLGMPNPGVDQDTIPGRRRYYFVWYRPVDYESTLPGPVHRRYRSAAWRDNTATVNPSRIHPPPQGERRITSCAPNGSRRGPDRAAASSSRLRSGNASTHIRQSCAPGRCRFCRSAACGRGSNQGGPRCTMSRRCTRRGGRRYRTGASPLRHRATPVRWPPGCEGAPFGCLSRSSPDAERGRAPPSAPHSRP